MDEDEITLRLRATGMHCQACETLIERRLSAVKGLRRVRARHGRGSVEVTHSGVDISDLNAAVAEDGYSLTPWVERGTGATSRDFLAASATLLILSGAYFLLRRFELLPEGAAIPDRVSYGAALVLGLAASVSTCMAVTGGLLVAVAARYNAARPGMDARARFIPHVWFAAGRLLAYPAFGAAIGALGSAVTPSPAVNAILIIVASAVMILFGLQLLRLLPPLGWLQPRMPKAVARKISELSENHARGGAFALGVLSFFLPCGFTQALQLYVLAQGDPSSGAWIMFAFALGTLPALLSVSALSSFASGSFQRVFVRVAGIAVVALGLINLQSGLTLSSVAAAPPEAKAAPGAQNASVGMSIAPKAGKQIVEMKVVGYSYIPNQFSIVAGLPVEWRIDATKAAGCARILLAPAIRVQEFLSSSQTTVINFTPPGEGSIAFNCGMGMMTPNSHFVVRAPT